MSWTFWEKLHLALLLASLPLVGAAYAIVTGAWEPPDAMVLPLAGAMTVVSIVGRAVDVHVRLVRRTGAGIELGAEALELNDRTLTMWRVLAFLSAPAYPVMIVSAELLHRRPNPAIAIGFLAVSVVCTTALARALNRRWWVWAPLTALVAGIPALVLAVQPRASERS